MDVHDKLDDLTATVESARSLPMSASCVLHRGEVLTMLDDIRELLPEELRRARALLADRDAVLAEARAEADRIVEGARAEREELVARDEIVRLATADAEDVRVRAAEEAARMRREVEEFVEKRLGDFEEVLERTRGIVARGREKMRAGGSADADPAARR